MTPQERHTYDEHLNAVMIQNDVLDTAKLEGRIEGFAEGRAKGRAEGIMEGERGALQKNAKRMKSKGLPLSDIADITSLAIEDIDIL